MSRPDRSEKRTTSRETREPAGDLSYFFASAHLGDSERQKLFKALDDFSLMYLQLDLKRLRGNNVDVEEDGLIDSLRENLARVLSPSAFRQFDYEFQHKHSIRRLFRTVGLPRIIDRVDVGRSGNLELTDMSTPQGP